MTCHSFISKYESQLKHPPCESVLSTIDVHKEILQHQVDTLLINHIYLIFYLSTVASNL